MYLCTNILELNVLDSSSIINLFIYDFRGAIRTTIRDVALFSHIDFCILQSFKAKYKTYFFQLRAESTKLE